MGSIPPADMSSYEHCTVQYSINPDRLAEMLAARDSHAQLRELVRQGSVFAHSIGDGGLPVSIGRTVAYHSRHCMVHAARE